MMYCAGAQILYYTDSNLAYFASGIIDTFDGATVPGQYTMSRLIYSTPVRLAA